MQKTDSHQLSAIGSQLSAAGSLVSVFSREQRVEAYELLAGLWLYPEDRWREQLAELRSLLAGDHPAAGALAALDTQTAALATADLEEAYIRVFDCNPSCAPEIGWHLFGEQYERGAFLVWMRAQLRRFGLSESSELPDHIAHVLPVLARMDAPEAREFATRCVLVAVQRVLEALRESESPYRHLVAATAALLEADFGPARADRPLPVCRPEPTEAMLACGVCR